VGERLKKLQAQLEIMVLTADTFGSVQQHLQGLPVTVRILVQPTGGIEKEAIVSSLGAEQVIAVGNGRNDAGMLKAAGLGIAVLGEEGLYAPNLIKADLLVNSPLSALDLLLNPRRLVATLRP